MGVFSLITKLGVKGNKQMISLDLRWKQGGLRPSF